MKPLFRQDKKRTKNIRVRSYELVRPILALDFNDGVAGPRGSRCWRQLVEVLEDLSLQWHRYAVISQISTYGRCTATTSTTRLIALTLPRQIYPI